MSTVTMTDKERFQQITGNCDGWASIDDLLRLCDESDFWTDEFLSKATRQAKAAQIRRLIKSLKGTDQFPEWASVETTNEDGKAVRVYKQELLFDLEDYRKVVTYHGERANYHRRMAKQYAKRCKKRFDIQLRLPLEG